VSLQPFGPLELKHNADLRVAWLMHDVFMTKQPTRAIISRCHHLDADDAQLAVGLMFGVLELGWAGKRFGLRLPLPADHDDVKRQAAQERRDYRKARKWLVDYLLPPDKMEQAEREEMTVLEMSEEFDVAPDICEQAMVAWIAKGRGLTPFF
jgi:hypothetical protein